MPPGPPVACVEFWRQPCPFVPAGLVLSVLSPPGPSRSGALERDAPAFIRSLAEEAVRTLTSRGTPRPECIERFRTMFDRHFAVPQIGKWILGRHWKKATEGERAARWPACWKSCERKTRT